MRKLDLIFDSLSPTNAALSCRAASMPAGILDRSFDRRIETEIRLLRTNSNFTDRMVSQQKSERVTELNALY